MTAIFTALCGNAIATTWREDNDERRLSTNTAGLLMLALAPVKTQVTRLALDEPAEDGDLEKLLTASMAGAGKLLPLPEFGRPGQAP